MKRLGAGGWLKVSCWRVVVLIAIALLNTPARADETKEEAAPDFRENLTGGWGGLRASMWSVGVDLNGGYTGEVFGNVTGGAGDEVVYAGLAEASLDFDTTRAGIWDGGRFHASSFYPHGRGLTGETLGDLSTVSNIEAAEELRLFEFWYEHRFFGETLLVRAGQLAADEQFAGTETGGLFLNATFGWPAFISVNAPAPSYPIGGLGASLVWRPTEEIEWVAGVYEGDTDPVDRNGSRLNRNGVRYDWGDEEGALLITEFAWLRDSGSLPGRYALGVWYHTGEFEHLRRDRFGRSLADPGSDGVGRRLDGNVGAYVSADQMIWRDDLATGEERFVRLFARAAGAPPERSLVELYFDAGVAVKGLIPGRADDSFGFAAGYLQLSREYRRLKEDMKAFGFGNGTAHSEAVVELTYLAVLTPWWSVQPDVQWIRTPGGDSDAEDAWVFGIRSQVIF